MEQSLEIYPNKYSQRIFDKETKAIQCRKDSLFTNDETTGPPHAKNERKEGRNRGREGGKGERREGKEEGRRRGKGRGNEKENRDKEVAQRRRK